MRIEPAAIVRYGLGIVFVIFGLMQLFDPASWLGYLPSFAQSILPGQTLIYLNGTLDLTIGLLLILGVFTRIIAIIAALHLAGITATLGFNEIAVRDFGLLIVAIAIALNGPDAWCLRKGKWF